uniref:Prenylcysteine oxidase 1 n=1 Tax=Oncorhynchus mykiss TaxID=8022 RepID=A0A8K9Y206_ONCMY
NPPKTIAVVGAGIGARHCGGGWGGGLATQNIGGYEYETGGGRSSSTLNLHMKHFLEKLGETYGMSHGKDLTFEESDWFIVNFLHLLQQYRFNFLLMQMWVDSVPDKFMRIYQQFTSVEKLLHAMGGDGFLTLANQMLEEAMLGEDISQSFLNDVVAPVNYGQSVRTSVFSGCEVNYVWESGFTHSLNYIVIVATSLHKGKPASFTSPPLQASPLLSPPSTLGTSPRLASLTCPTRGPEIPLPSVCQDILTTDSIINSLSSIDPVHIPPGYSCPPVNESKVWKVFSSQPLSQEQLQDMFLSRSQSTPRRDLSPGTWHCWHTSMGRFDQEDLHTKLVGEICGFAI